MRDSESSSINPATILTAVGLIASAAVIVFVTRGDYLGPATPELASIIAAGILVLYTVITTAFFFAGSGSPFQLSISLAISWVVIGRVAIDFTGGIASPLYPAAYVLAGVAGAYAPASLTILGIFIFAGMEGSQAWLTGQWNQSVWKLTSHTAGLLAAAGVVGSFFRSERKKTSEFEEELAVYRRGHAAFSESADEFRSIREEGRRAQLRESVLKLQDALHHIMNDLYDILKPHTIILFTRDPKTRKMCFRDAISATENINRSATVGEGEGLLGWMWRELESLRLTSYHHPPENLVYYNNEERVQSLLAVPVIRNSTGEAEGLLVADSLQEGYFTPEDERLIWLSARQVMQELETAEQRRREVNEARISHALYKVSDALNSSIDLDEVLDATMACVTRIADADLVALSLYDRHQSNSYVARATGGLADSFKGKRFNPDESLVGWVTTPEQYLYYPDFKSRKVQKPVFGKNFPSIKKNIGTFFCYPLVSGSDFLGSITVIFREEGAINDYERNALNTTARMAATSIANANLHRRVEQLATTDGLTGLHNHRYFQERLSERIEEARRHPTHHTLLLLDIDHFKQVNDKYGHPVGDEVLRSLAGLFKSSIRNVDLAARYGGEEFVLLLANTRREGAIKLANRIRKAASRLKFETENKTFKVTISMGITTFPEDAKGKSSLIERADQALYYAKENGRNQVVLYHDIRDEAESDSNLPAERY